MVKDEDLEAGRPQVLLLLGELVSKGGSSRSALRKSSVLIPALPFSSWVCLIPTEDGALFLHAFNTFWRLIASTEFFFNTLGFCCCCSLSLLLFDNFSLCCFGDCGGDVERPDNEERPEETAESLSESSVLVTGQLVGKLFVTRELVGKLSSEFRFPIGGLHWGLLSSFSSFSGAFFVL